MKIFSPSKRQLPYTLSAAGAAVYYTSLAVALGLILTRNSLRFPFYHHASNFSISYMLMTSFGFALLHRRSAWRYILFGAALLLVANVITEAFIPVLNTPDLLDAVFGAIGTLIGVAILWIMHRYLTHPKLQEKTDQV